MQNVAPFLDKVHDPVTRIEGRPEVGVKRQFASPNLRRVLWIGSPLASHFRRVVGLFWTQKYFMSAANRRCPAFLMVSIASIRVATVLPVPEPLMPGQPNRDYRDVRVNTVTSSSLVAVADRSAPSGQHRTSSGRRLPAPHE